MVKILREEIFCVDEFQIERVGDGFIGNFSGDCVQTFGKSGVFAASNFPTFAGDFERVRQSCVGERER